MKKSTIAVASLLTALSSVPMVSVAYAEENAAAATNMATHECKAAGECKAAHDDAQKTEVEGSTDHGACAGSKE